MNNEYDLINDNPSDSDFKFPIFSLVNQFLTNESSRHIILFVILG